MRLGIDSRDVPAQCAARRDDRPATRQERRGGRSLRAFAADELVLEKGIQ
jgi:hypothetical protein